jgi:S-adenosylmethionine-diacylglycerol 3-amino-3-carboxypropyl transferase
VSSAWLDRAKVLPLGFAQVREDPAIDEAIVGFAGDAVRVLMVASGGCTAAFLAASPRVSHLHLVDPNPAQIALARLKLGMLADSNTGARLRLLGHAEMQVEDRAQQLTARFARLNYSADAIGPQDRVAQVGPDGAGRYEHLFAELRRVLSDVQPQMEELLELRDPSEQAKRVASKAPLGVALDAAFREVMALPNLVALFGEGATGNPRMPFADHFALQTRWILGSQPAADNSFLSQMFLGTFASGAEHAWLRAAPPKKFPRITWEVGSMINALASADGKFDVVHLSNILDWLSPDCARKTLDLAMAALRPGGWLTIRQLNSTLDIQGIGENIAWQSDLSRRMLSGDRSFFYRAVHVGRRP